MFACFDEWAELVDDEVVPLFVGEFVGVGVEAFGFAGVVAGVDADSFDAGGCGECGVWVEMDVGYEWGVVVVFVEFGSDESDVAGFFLALGGESDYFASRVDDLD